MSDKFYIVHPNGRMRLGATSVAEAFVEFEKHWSQKALWNGRRKQPVARLIHVQEIELKVNQLLWEPM